MEKGYLCPVKYYAGEQPDLETIKIKRDTNGIADYDPEQLSLEMQKPKLIGDAVETWKKLGENAQTIAFALLLHTPADWFRHSKTQEYPQCTLTPTQMQKLGRIYTKGIMKANLKYCLAHHC